MPEYRRPRAKGGTFFFTVCTLERKPILTSDAMRMALRTAIRAVRTIHPFEIDAWVLLPDHLHCIWTLPENDADFGLRWAIIKQEVTRQCANVLHSGGRRSVSGIKRREAALWQRRFWEHRIRDEADLSNHMDYLHWNPVKHGYAVRVLDWPYSTFHRFVAAGIHPEDWGGDDIGKRASGNYGE
ncbi:MAG: REP-associated tyrosine transposase [Gammaproteobacteria bacterium]